MLHDDDIWPTAGPRAAVNTVVRTARFFVDDDMIHKSKTWYRRFTVAKVWASDCVRFKALVQRVAPASTMDPNLAWILRDTLSSKG